MSQPVKPRKGNTNTRMSDALTRAVVSQGKELAAAIEAGIQDRLNHSTLVQHTTRGDLILTQPKGLGVGQAEQTYSLLSLDQSYQVLKGAVKVQESAESASLSLCYHILSAYPGTYGEDWKDTAKALTKYIGEQVKAARPDDAALLLSHDTFRQVRAKATKAVAFSKSASCMLHSDGMLKGRISLGKLVPKADQDIIKAVEKALELLTECGDEAIQANAPAAREAVRALYRAIGHQVGDAIASVQSAEQTAKEVLNDASIRARLQARRELELATEHQASQLHQAA